MWFLLLQVIWSAKQRFDIDRSSAEFLVTSLEYRHQYCDSARYALIFALLATGTKSSDCAAFVTVCLLVGTGIIAAGT
jgi:hypothetical protein